MKKLIISLMCLLLVSMPVFSTELLQDSLVEQTLKGKDLKINKVNNDLIQDSFAEKTLINISPKQYANKQKLEDEFVNKTITHKQYEIKKQENIAITDDFANATLKNIPIKAKKADTKFDFESIKQIPIRISITKNSTSKKGLKEGQELDFKVLNDVNLENNLKLKKDSIITARLETISLNQAFGVPADIVIDNFKVVSDKSEINLEGSIHKIGANRSLWVYPAATGGMVFFFMGALFIPIRGGHAKINTKNIYEVYYVPNSI